MNKEMVFYVVKDQSGWIWYISNNYNKVCKFWLHKGGWPLYSVEII